MLMSSPAVRRRRTQPRRVATTTATPAENTVVRAAVRLAVVTLLTRGAR